MLVRESGVADVPPAVVAASGSWRDLASVPRGYEENFLVKLRWEDDGVRFAWDVAWLTPKGVIDGPWKYSDTGLALAEIVGWQPGPEL